MKRALAVMVLIILFVSQVFAFGYPNTFAGLFAKYCEQHTTLHVVTLYIGLHKLVYKYGDPVVPACKEYVGQVIVASLDYFTFKTTDGDVVIIPYTAVVEVTEE